MAEPLQRKPGLRHRFARDQRGIIIIMFALMLPIIVGFIGLGVEVAYWFAAKRDLQAAADAAAIAGSYELAEGRSSSVGTVATQEATNNGWDSSSGTITIRSFDYNATYPASGSYTADQDAVEVVLTQDQNLMFAGYFLSNSVTINSRAVGLAVAGDNEACLLALGSSNAAKAMWVHGSAAVTMTGCSAMTNSTDDAAITTTSGLSVDCVYSAGGVSGTPTTTACSGAKENVPASTDPYESLTKPVASDFDSCTTYNDPNNADDSITAGVYCGISFGNNNKTLTLGAGTYYLDSLGNSANKGNLKMSASGGTIDGSAGVTFVFGDSTWDGTPGTADCGGLNLTGGTLNLTAPDASSGEPYPGIIFYRSSECDSGADIEFGGNNDSTLYGAIYSPAGEIKTSGTGAVSGTCLQFIADTIELTGTSSLGSTCDADSGVQSVTAGGKGSLVE